ncbi:MAG: tetratricopeptide repeat protein [Pseudomonadota bacterium]|nr:tetratricopeptide repeat protein [Pseudomonadota bacterium]
MSLINDYLKKSRAAKTQSSSSASAEVPPVMRQAQGGGNPAHKEKKISPKTVMLLVLTLLLGGAAYYFTMPPAPSTYNNQSENKQSDQTDSLRSTTDSNLVAGEKIESGTVGGDLLKKVRKAGENHPLKREVKNGIVKSESRTTVGEIAKKGLLPEASPLSEKRNSAASDNVATPGFSAKPEPVSDVDSLPVEPETEMVNSEPGSVNISSVPISSGADGVKISKPALARVRRPRRKDDIDHLFQVGVLALSSGNRSRAYYYFNQVLELDRKHQEALLNMAVILLQGNDFAKARKVLIKAAGNDPFDARVKVNQGLIELKSDDYESAQKLFVAALLLDPGSRSALNNLVWLALQSGDKRAAAGYYRNLVALDPQRLKPLLAYASFCEREKSFNQAIDLYREALKSRFLENDRPLERRIRSRIKLLTDYVE